MFKCECGCVFEYPKAVAESRGEFWGFPAYETMYYCPACDSDNFAEYNEDEDYEEDEDEYFED